MKKILAVFVLAAVCLSGVSAKKTIKDHIDQVKIGKFKEVDISDGVFRLKKTFGSSLIATEYTVKLYGKDGSVGIYYKNDLASKESLRFDKDGRDALRKAYELYIQDYEAKKLKKSKKFVEAYGAARTKLVWKLLSDSATVHPKVYFGYCFVGKSPYFCIKVRPATSEEKKGDVIPQHCGAMIYFTRSQLKELLDGMDEGEIQKAYESVVGSSRELAEDTDYEEESEEAEYEEAPSDIVVDKDSRKSKKSKEESQKNENAVEFETAAEAESTDYKEE